MVFSAVGGSLEAGAGGRGEQPAIRTTAQGKPSSETRRMGMPPETGVGSGEK
jgi:hypothetical protein